MSMFCTDTCHKQPLGKVLHSVEIRFVTSFLKGLSCPITWQKHKEIFAFYIIYWHRDGGYNFYTSASNAMAHLSYVLQFMITDALTMQESIASAAVILILVSKYTNTPAPQR